MFFFNFVFKPQLLFFFRHSIILLAPISSFIMFKLQQRHKILCRSEILIPIVSVGTWSVAKKTCCSSKIYNEQLCVYKYMVGI